MSRPFAQLIEDGGASAVGGVGGHPSEFFRGAHFLAAEGATHTLRIETDDAELLAPLIVREIDGGPDLDAVSPYGYPGFSVVGERRGGGDASTRPRSTSTAPGSSPSSSAIGSTWCRSPARPSATSSRSHDPALKPKSRPSDRRQVRRNLEAGYAVELIPGAETSAAQRAAFLDLYEQTMRRTDAAAALLLRRRVLRRASSPPSAPGWRSPPTPTAPRPPPRSPASRDGYLHYYLCGSADSRLGDSPMKNVLARLIEHADELELPLNLGGGIHRRRRAGGVQARLRQPHARLAHLRGRLRPGALRRAHRRPRRGRVLPRLPRAGLSAAQPIRPASVAASPRVRSHGFEAFSAPSTARVAGARFNA